MQEIFIAETSVKGYFENPELFGNCVFVCMSVCLTITAAKASE